MLSYEDIGYEYLGNNLMRFHSRKYFFKASLLLLVLNDDIGAEKKVEKYSDDDPNFNSCMEKKFVLKIIEAIR